MGRVLSLEALAGLPTGPGRVVVELVDDHFISGRYVLDGMTGMLDIGRGQHPAPTATLTTMGLAGLLYGVLEPEDIVIRGFGDIPRDTADQLHLMFPELIPYFFAHF